MQAWHKEQKQKAIKKGKSAALKERQEKLARRNPERLQRQIDDLQSTIDAGHGTPHTRRMLSDLEKDLAAVKKARKALGIVDREVKRKREDGDGEGKKVGGNGEESEDETTDEDVRSIPLPKGPLPEMRDGKMIPLVQQKEYEAKPVIRDLRKEAVGFVPVAVKRKLEMQKTKTTGDTTGETEEEGKGKRLAVEETTAGSTAVEGTERAPQQAFSVRVNAAPDVDDELKKFQAEVEDIADEDG